MSAGELRATVREFIRRFGVLNPEQTPYGHPIGTSHACALAELKRVGRPLVQRELAEALHLDKSNVARLCGRMRDAGHVEVQESSADARARTVALTMAGARLADQLDSASLEHFAGLLSHIPTSEHEAVLQGIRALNVAIVRLEAARESGQAPGEST